MSKIIYREVKCDYIDETDDFWRVDAWKTDNDEEEGRVVAFIDDLTARVLYNGPDAMICQNCKDVIAEKVKEIKQNIKSNLSEANTRFNQYINDP